MWSIKHDKVEQIIREVAANEIMPRFRNLKEGDISFKIGDDPVTIADKKAEAMLAKRLSDLLPGSRVVGEEAYAANPHILDAFDDNAPVWIVDPIDGTRNFVAGKQAFGVIVALSIQNQTVAGWLYHPTSNEFVTAEKGCGAFYNNERLKVLPADKLENMRGVFGYQIYHAYEQLPEMRRKEMATPCFATPSKAGCHDFPRLVIQKPHFGCDEEVQWHFRSLLQTCSPWDDAAPLMIHEEAGGYSAHWDGSPFRPSSYGRGFLAAPDKESWDRIKDWVEGFCTIPKAI